MALRFVKMHGLGNDYVYVNVFDQALEDPAGLAPRISDRHRGVGGDGLILVGPPRQAGAHVRMVMYNADGSRAQMCGNGVRCVGKLAWDDGLARANPMRIETDAGVLTLDLELDRRGLVAAARVDMGAPVLEPERIPVVSNARRAVGIEVNLADAAATAGHAPAGPHARAADALPALRATCVSMGNPHAVFFCDDVDAVPLADWGPRIERHRLFPQRVNAHFVQVLTREHLRMRTWERGAGATQACGTGACAVCVAAVLNGLAERAVRVALPGGELRITWDETTNHVQMAGPAHEVFRGQWP